MTLTSVYKTNDLKFLQILPKKSRHFRDSEKLLQGTNDVFSDIKEAASVALKIPWRDYSPDGWKYAQCKQALLLPSHPRQLPDTLTI